MTMIIKVLICFVLFNLLALAAGIEDENTCPKAALEKVKALENINDELGKQQELLSRTLLEQKSEIERLKALLIASDNGNVIFFKVSYSTK